jgi:hypothetical protein
LVDEYPQEFEDMGGYKNLLIPVLYIFLKSSPSQYLTMALGNFISRMNECHARGGCFYTKGPPWKQEKHAGLPEFLPCG